MHNNEKLSIAKIKHYLPKTYHKYSKKLLLFNQVNSTNDFLLGLTEDSISAPIICLAEKQTSGRGRLARIWYSPRRSNIYLSILWNFSHSPEVLSALSLISAIAVIQALQKFGIKKHLGLKWPNDVFYQQQKLAGILLELKSNQYHGTKAIIGVGLNVNMPKIAAKKIPQNWIDVKKIINKPADRNKLAAYLIQQLIKNLATFEKSGSAHFIKSWQQFDITKNQPVILITTKQKTFATSCGIDPFGRLLIKTKNAEIQKISSGEISLQITS
ncbi:MAG: biotin--[acetyl-CoA-carboxylase] ligase [Gammaproteobacteria bacterium]|nr:biotin--[acetyl-CoA-carboxylase] ligase [Gammaproteobacteria bacterium]